ncbi:MAG: trypsin-like peptidase domain-containing protein, partial [Bacilli bacterium]
MGYYDNIDRTQKKTSTKTWLLSVVIASMVGSGTTMVAMPYVTKSYAEIGQATPTVNNEQNIVPTQATAVNTINTDIVQAVNGVRPAIVTVVNMKSGQGYFNNSGSAPAGTGSGVIIDEEGHIVTNYHVVEGASEIEIVLNSENIKATVIGTDEFTDLAVLKVSPEAIKDIK